MKAGLKSIILLLFIGSCTNLSSGNDSDSLYVSPTVDSPLPLDIQDVLDSIDPCSFIQTGGDGWCECNPQCCKVQLWFCQPTFGDPSYYKKEVIVDICDEDKQSCIYGQDIDCPPPEIIYVGECLEAYACPPGSQSLDYGWQWCEMADGVIGKQQVICDKGQLYTTPCQPCDPEVCDDEDNDCDGLVDEDLNATPCTTECGNGNMVCIDGVETCIGPKPQEEICDYKDNDCDGDVDEFQRNACNECGPTLPEICNGIDDDCNGTVDENLVQQCSTACGVGIEICNNGGWVGCTAKLPDPEICDGFDNDCNGQIDDGIECVCTVQDVGMLMPCTEPPLLCGKGYKTCKCVDDACTEIIMTECLASCYWLSDPWGSDPTCDPYVGIPLQQEKCNNFDDNCNDLIDEDLIVGCYTGPEETLNVGICEQGQMICEIGSWGSIDNQGFFIPGLCMDEILPAPEICDGIDNDCDGKVDWDKEVPDTDILFIVDWSGSMGDEINAVLVALNQFASQFQLEDALHWGLIVGPRTDVTTGDTKEKLFLISDIAPFQDFLNGFASLGNEGMDTGNEMLLDAIYLALQNVSGNLPFDVTTTTWDMSTGESLPPKDQFNISWRPGTDKIIIIFTDEHPQSFLIPKITPQHIINTAQGTPQLKVYTFALSTAWDWKDIADQCGGSHYKLSSNSTEMYGSLMEILEEICKSPSSP